MMGEPRHLTAQASQPIGWPTYRYQFCLKTVMPSEETGTNMTLLKNIKRELLPRYNNKLPERWRAVKTLPPIYHSTPQPQPETRPVSHDRSAPSREKLQSQGHQSISKSEHLDIRPPSAYSTSIIIKRPANNDWSRHNRLNMERLRAFLRDSTYHPGNFSTLYKCTKRQIQETSDRLSYNPYERREQIILTENAGETDAKYYTKEDIDAIVARLTAKKETSPASQPEPMKKPNRELSAKEKEIVERLTKAPEPKDKTKEADAEKKTVTKAQLEDILSRLTQKKPEALPQDFTIDTKKVSQEELENILSRLMTFDAEKWPPESKPHIFKKQDE